ncbi:hypothetical protein KR044_008663, partial [Drosophila immigrans]
ATKMSGTSSPQTLQECRNGDKDASATSFASQHVEFAMHTNQSESASASASEAMPAAEEAELQSRSSTAADGVSEQLAEEIDDNRWGRVLRVLTRCLMYCSARVAAGFGLSRQQTAWYKHCWDNPGQRPRGMYFLEARQ